MTDQILSIMIIIIIIIQASFKKHEHDIKGRTEADVMCFSFQSVPQR